MTTGDYNTHTAFLTHRHSTEYDEESKEKYKENPEENVGCGRPREDCATTNIHTHVEKITDTITKWTPAFYHHMTRVSTKRELQDVRITRDDVQKRDALRNKLRAYQAGD